MWKSHGGNMEEAMSAIPKDTGGRNGYSTPDAYGRAAQFYLSLQSATEQALFSGKATRTWRGLIAMLALRNVLNLPLRWEAVQFLSLDSSDLLGGALRRPPTENLYPDEPDYQWDGKSFYVLTWAPDGARQYDLAIYSPITLVYPVADWRQIFFDASEESHILRKFFHRAQDLSTNNAASAKASRARNIKASAFRDCLDCFQDGERKFLYFWLNVMRNHLYGRQADGSQDTDRSTPSEAKDVIRQHLEHYMKDLLARDGSLKSASADTLEWAPFPEYVSARYAGLPRPLISAYDIPGGPVFSEQICYLQVEHPGDNPFSPCNYPQNYQIEGQLEPSSDLYAFLPIHPERRETCLTSGLAQSLRMKIISDPGGDASKQYIRVSAKLNILGDFPLERDYLISPVRTDKPDTAVGYKYSGSDENAELNPANWPLIAVWPDVIGTGWNEYYVMRTEREPNHLRLYHETPWESNPDAPVTRGSNNAVVKTAYVPDAIPFVREILPGKQVSVGMVTPRIHPRHGGSTEASVAVDFGTTATRVFYSMAAHPGVIEEIIPSPQDKPLEVTKLQEDAIGKYGEMGESFISPRSPALMQGSSLLSIFRRSEPVNKANVPPLLEGVIYHPDNDTDADRDDPRLLVTDLKWDGGMAGPYYIAFMQQLCLHVMSILYRERGVNKLNWVYALPKAMEEERGGTKRVRDIWKNLEDFLNRTGGEIQSSVWKPLTESVAASRFFAVNHIGEINKKKGYMVVDIGGGTTDVALWWSRDARGPATLQWHTSVKVAGRKMFTAWVERQLEEIDDSVSHADIKTLISQILKPNEPLSEDAKTALTDRLLSSYGDALKEEYFRQWGKTATSWAANLYHRLTQATTLLMFCLGYQVGALMQAKREIDRANPTERDKTLFHIDADEPGYFSIAVAGRGSLMWDWLPDCEETQLREFFKTGVRASGARWPDVEIRIVIDSDPKGSVGKGLLQKPANLDMSDGWGALENSHELEEDMQTGAYYYDAAGSFLDAYSKMFPEDNIVPKLGRDSLAGHLQHATGKLNDAFKTLLENLYEYLEGRKP